MRRAIICGALMALAITTASAQQSLFSANSVLPGCKAVFEEGRGLGRQDTGYCVGAINALVFLAPTECIEIPDGVTFLQILVVVGRFIEARPERMDDAFVGLAFEALLDAWPCRKTPGPPPDCRAIIGQRRGPSTGGYSVRVITLAPVTAAPSCAACALRLGR